MTHINELQSNVLILYNRLPVDIGTSSQFCFARAHSALQKGRGQHATIRTEEGTPKNLSCDWSVCLGLGGCN